MAFSASRAFRATASRFPSMPTRLLRNLVLKNQVILGTVNAGREAFEAAIRDLGVFYQRWPDAVRSLITGRYPIEEFREPILERIRDQECHCAGRKHPDARRESQCRARSDWPKTPGARRTGSAGGRIFPSGNGARSVKTIRRRRLLGLFSARSCAQPRLPLGRRRAARHLRPRRPPVLCAGALERPRSHPEGAAVRACRAGGQSRRGREGVLLLPRLHAHALLHEGALQISAGGVSVCAAGRGEQPRRNRQQPEFELLDTGVFEQNRYFDVFAEYAKADTDDILIRITVDEPRTGGGHAASAADALVSQHLVLGAHG